MPKQLTFLLFLVVVASLTLLVSFLFPLNARADLGDITPSLPNPLGENVTLTDVILRAMQLVLAIVDIFALFMFILGGFEFLVSAGNPQMIKKAKDTLVWATLGILVITLSYSILKFVFETIQKKF